MQILANHRLRVMNRNLHCSVVGWFCVCIPGIYTFYQHYWILTLFKRKCLQDVSNKAEED